MCDNSKTLVLSFVIINTVLISLDTTTQILHYFFTTWGDSNAKGVALMFLILRPATLGVIFISYLLFHYEFLLTCEKKLITLFLFLVCMYIGYTPGVHLSFYSKFYLESESGIIICRVVNVFAFIFITLPKVLIIPINANSTESGWNWIDYLALIVSCMYIIWCVAYYIMCNVKEFDFELEMEDISKVWTIVEAEEKDSHIEDSYDKKKEKNTIAYADQYNLKDLKDENLKDNNEKDIIKKKNTETKKVVQDKSYHSNKSSKSKNSHCETNGVNHSVKENDVEIIVQNINKEDDAISSNINQYEPNQHKEEEDNKV